MKKLIYIFLFLTFGAHAQEFPCTLIGEGNISTVKLKCVPTAWPNNLEGFHIQRREIGPQSSGAWKQLSKALIIPGISKTNRYENVETSYAEQIRLKKKLDSLIVKGRTKEISLKDFKSNYLSNEGQIENLKMGFLVDFDFALIQGFGFVDRQVPSTGSTYEYGVFAQFTGKTLSSTPSASFTWQQGTRIDLAVDANAKVKRIGRKGKIKVSWKFQSEDLKGKGVTAFKVSRTLNGKSEIIQTKTFISTAYDLAVLQVDDQIDPDAIVTYSAIPFSNMGSEGTGIEVVYSKKSAEIDLLAPELIESNTSAKNEVAMQWTFDSEDEIYLKQFVITRNNIPKNQSKSFLVNPKARSFVDTTLTESGDFNYVIYLLKTNDEKIQGTAFLKRFNYLKTIPQPTDVTGDFKTTDKQNIITLSWKTEPISEELSYRVLIKKPNSDYFSFNSQNTQVNQNSATISVGEFENGYWQIAVRAIDQKGNEGERSAPITILVPSKEIPAVGSIDLKNDNSKALISWNYYAESVPDLAGFRLYQNGQLIANEDQIKASKRTWTTSELSDGKNIFAIEAITLSGISSPQKQGLLKITNE